MADRRIQAGLIALFEREGYVLTEPPVLQPADIFLDLSGEDLRRRMFVTQDASGRELCLRPEYTIPVCREHLAAFGLEPGSYAYCGPVFRLRTGESGEFLQAGIESIGRRDAAAADAEVIAVAMEGLALIGIADVDVQIGDVGLLDALVEALKLSPAAKRRLLRRVASGRSFDFAAEPVSSARLQHAGLLAAIEGQAPQAAKAFVEDILSIAGIASVGGRSAGEIAERFLSRAANRSSLSADERALIARYLGIAGHPDDAAAAIRRLAGEAGLDLDRALDLFEERTGFMAARGIDIESLRFSAAFARNLDYYTGFIFEMSDPELAGGRPLVGGGRYDGLLAHLGAPRPMPAVGCSFWLDRIAAPALPRDEAGHG